MTLCLLNSMTLHSVFLVVPIIFRCYLQDNVKKNLVVPFHSLTYIHSSIHCKSFIFVCVAIWHDYSQCLQFYNLLHFEIFDRSEFWVDSVIKYTRLFIYICLFIFLLLLLFRVFFLSFSIVVNFIWAIQGMSYKVFHGIIYCIGRVCEKHKTNIG